MFNRMAWMSNIDAMAESVNISYAKNYTFEHIHITFTLAISVCLNYEKTRREINVMKSIITAKNEHFFFCFQI